MSVVFDFFKRRITEGGSSWWKETDFFAVLVNKKSEDIDSGSTTIESSDLEEVSGVGYYRLKTANHVVYQLDDSGRIVYSVDDLKWENSSVSADGVLLVDGSDRPLIFVDFGYRRISESDLFSVVWGENGILYLDTSSSDIVDNGTSGSIPNQVSLTDAENIGSGVGVFSRILNRVKLQFRTIIGDKWIKVSNDGDTIGLKLNTDFLVAGDNVKLTSAADGSVKIDVVIKNSGSDNLSTEIKDKLSSLKETVDDHIDNGVIHITQTERDRWNSASGNVGSSGGVSYVGVVDYPSPEWVDNGSGSITIEQTHVMLYDNANYVGVPQKYVVPSKTLTLTNGGNQILIAAYNSGVPEYRLVDAPGIGQVDRGDACAVYRFWYAFGEIHSASIDSLGLGLSNKIANRIGQTQYYARVGNTGLELFESTERIVHVTSSQVWAGPVSITVENFVSSSDSFSLIYKDAYDAWHKQSLTQYPNTQYNPSGGILSLPTNRYTALYIYRSIGDVKEAFCVLDDEYYNTELEASTESQPRTGIPLFLQSHCLLVGRIIIHSGASTNKIESAWVTNFNVGSSVADHNSLNNLQGGEPTFYGHNTELMQYRQTQAGSANGYALLTSGGYIPTSVIPDSFFNIYTLLVGASGLDYFVVPNPAGTSDVSFTAYDVPSKTSVGVSLFVSDDVVSASDLVPFTQDNQLKIVMISGKHQSASTGLLLRIDIAEVSMLCLDGSDGKGNEFVLTAVGSTSSLDYIEWTSSNNSIATVEKVSATSAIVRGVSKIGTGLGSDVYITCTQGSIQKTCLFTIYETMPLVHNNCKTLKGGNAPGNSSSVSAYAIFSSSVSVDTIKINNFRLCIDFYVPSASSSYSQFCVNKSDLQQHSFPIEYQYAAGSQRPSVSTWSSSTRTDVFYGSVMGFGSYQSLEFVKSTDGVYLNGVLGSVYGTASGTFSQSSAYGYGYVFRNNTKKATWVNESISSTKTQLENSPSSLEMSHCFQNYIRYSDTTFYTNYTVIPNIGTLGSAYDLTANNVPAAWFGV